MPYDGRLLAGVSVLMAVVEAGGMARAAEALGLTPSGVGRAIARLEARVGVRLLDRTTRAMRLTDEGGVFTSRSAHTLMASRRRRSKPLDRAARSADACA